MKKIAVLIVVSLVLGFTTPASSSTIFSLFSSGDEGWTASGATVTRVSQGGNQGGYLRVEDNRDDTFSLFAPAKFYGDLLKYDGGLLTYDVLLINPTTIGNIGSGFGRIQLLGGGSNATFDYAPNPSVPSADFWKQYQVPLTAGAWNTTQENWETVLSGVTTLDIILEPTGNSTVGLDNFKFQNPVPPGHTVVNPEPATFLLLGSGLLGAFARRRKRA